MLFIKETTGLTVYWKPKNKSTVKVYMRREYPAAFFYGRNMDYRTVFGK